MMMNLQAQNRDKRQFPRAHARFVVAYGIGDDPVSAVDDVSQTRDIGLGGIRFTTSRPFAPDTSCMLKIRLPIAMHPVEVKGRILSSREITPNSIYETRVAFLDIDDSHRKCLDETVNYYVRKEALKGY